MSLYSKLFYSEEVNALFSDAKAITQLLRVEASLAMAQANKGLFAHSIAETITSCSKESEINTEQLKNDIPLGGNVAIPLIKQLTALVAKKDQDAAKYVHLGATSQDVVDTALILTIQDFLAWIHPKIKTLEQLLVFLTQEHRQTIMIGRTLLQQAKPTTFGFKTAGWLEAISRSKHRIQEIEKRILLLQLGGAVGNANANISLEIQNELASLLDLKTAFCWHTNRDNLAEWASILAILGASLGKIAKDISLLMQTEIAEVYEGAAAGKGGSSSMPHKRNPVMAAAIIANATRLPHLAASIISAMGQENERSAGLWHSEWEVLEECMKLSGGALEKTIALIQGLEIDKNQMLANLEITNGLIYSETISSALAKKIGKAPAHEILEKAAKTAILEKKHLQIVLEEMKIDLEELDSLFKPENALGLSLEMINTVLIKYL